MASDAHSTSAPARASSIQRRLLLAGLVALPAAALPASASAWPTASRAAWDRALAAYLAAKRAADLYDQQVYSPLYALVDHEAPQTSLWFELPRTHPTLPAVRFYLPHDNLHALDNYHDDIVRAEAGRIREAYLRRQALKQSVGFDDVSDEHERLVDVHVDLSAELILMAAPDRAALLWKLEHLFGAETRGKDRHSDSWCPEWCEAFMADAHRLLGGGQA